MHKLAMAVLVLGTVGCGNGPCVERAGTYTWKMTARSGDCGDYRESVFSTMGTQELLKPPCTGTITYSPDACQVTHDHQCPIGAPDEGTVDVQGVVHWDVFGSQGDGVLEYRIKDKNGAQVCQGTYDAHYTRL